jgi:pyruvate kinase
MYSPAQRLPCSDERGDQGDYMAKRTKIVCTLGPAVDSESTLKSLITSGMDIARFNFSHGTHTEHLARMNRLKKIRRELDTPTAILLDTRGPEIRTGAIKGGQPIHLSAGKTITLTEREVEGTERLITQSYKGLWRVVEPGSAVLIDNGSIELIVDEVRGEDVCCTVQNTGMLGSHKSVNIPGISVDLPSMTEADEQDLLFGIEQDIDFVAASFIRSADDVRAYRAFLAAHGGEDIAIISKIESRESVENIDEIVEVSDGVMIARGDLGVEVDANRVPHIQKRIIKLCNAKHTPVITATQMLDSMMRNPRPTRAEVGDVANAIYDGTDALLLSGETAIGKYPIPTVRMMAQIAEASEPYVDEHMQNGVHYSTDVERVSPSVGRAAVQTAEAIHATCIVTPTTSGRTARLISNLRPGAPIYAVTKRERVMRRMQLYWGVTPMLGNVEDAPMRTVIANAREAVCRHGYVRNGDLTVFTAGDHRTSPYLPKGATGETQSAPTNVMYVVEIRSDNVETL